MVGLTNGGFYFLTDLKIYADGLVDYWEPTTVEQFAAKVRSDRLAGRPDSTDRCLTAADAYVREQTEANRTALREAYLAIPEHLRHYALGDMDRKDWPLRALAFDLGEESRQDALAYFTERDEAQTAIARRVPADGPDRADYHHPGDGLSERLAVGPRGLTCYRTTTRRRSRWPAPTTPR